MFLDCFMSVGNRRKEVFREAGFAVFIPLGGGHDFRRRLRKDSKVHLAGLRRIEARIRCKAVSQSTALERSAFSSLFSISWAQACSASSSNSSDSRLNRR